MMIDALAFGGDRLIGHGNAGGALVLLREIVHGKVHALEFTAGNRQITRLLRAHGQADGIELPAQLLARDVLSRR